MSDELIFLAVVLVILVLVCFVLDFVPSQKIEEVTGIVTDLTYEPPQAVKVLTYDTTSKKSVWITETTPAIYSVTITYGDISTTIDDATLYNSVSIGDYVKMTLNTTRDFLGNVDTSLQIPEVS